MLDREQFRAALEKHFRFIGGLDNLPELASPTVSLCRPDGTKLPRDQRRSHGRVALAKTMSDLGLTKGVEIGCRYGASALLWCEHIPGLQLTCYDPYRAYHRIGQPRQDKIFAGAQENAAGKFRIIRAASLDVVDSYEDGILDWVHIDGDHSFDAAVQDIIRWAPKVREGGLVLVHDYCVFGLSGVIPAIDAYTSCHKIDPWYVTRDMEPTAFWMRGMEKAGLGS